MAEAAKAAGCLTVGVVTKPFSFEGQRRTRQADGAIERLKAHVDAMIVVSNDRLLDIVEEGTPLQEAFCVADDILRQGVVGISDIIIKPGLINVDFADVQSIMGSSGLALMGIGTAEGKGRARDAAIAALSSPLIDFPIYFEATGIVFTITGASDMSLQEVNEAAEAIYGMADPDANIIFGAQVDDSMGSVLSITVVATGFERRQLRGAGRVPRRALPCRTLHPACARAPWMHALGGLMQLGAEVVAQSSGEGQHARPHGSAALRARMLAALRRRTGRSRRDRAHV